MENDLASDKQKKMFFALCNELKLDHDKTKDALKRKLSLDSFTNITKKDLTTAIESLLKKVGKENETALREFFKMHTPEEYAEKNFVPGLYTTYEDYLTGELLRFFEVKEKNASNNV